MHGTLMAAKKLRPTGPYRIGQIVDYAGKRENATCQVINLTDPDERRWYVVQVEPQQEDQVCDALRKAGMNAYFPKEPKKIRVNAVRHRTVNRPLFVGYVFAGFDILRDGWMAIPIMRGVVRLFMVDSRPLPIPDNVMARIMAKEIELASRHGKAPPILLRVGTIVRILEPLGFTGLFGTVVRIDEKKQEIDVEIDMFGRMVAVTTSPEKVEAV